MVKEKLKSTKIMSNEIGASKLKINKLVFKEIHYQKEALSRICKIKQELIVRNQVYKQESCLPQKIPISSFLQLPFWMYLTGAVRNLTTGSFGNKFTNLYSILNYS